MTQQLTATVFGQVQGVNFRASVKMRAITLGLVGWVKNLPTGNVVFMAEGESEHLHEFLRWLLAKPGGVQIIRVEDHWGPASGAFTHFTIQ